MLPQEFASPLSPFEIEAMLLSLKVGVWSMLGALPIAIALAWVLARHDFIGKSLVDALLHLPLVLPPVSIGFILLILFGRQGWVGKPLADWFGITVMFKWQGAAIASAVMALPLTVGAIRLSIAAVDQKLEAAARSLGASELTVLFRVIVPNLSASIVAASGLTAALVLGEFAFASLLLKNTLPTYLVNYQRDSPQAGMALALAVMVLTALALGAVVHMLRRRGLGMSTTGF